MVAFQAALQKARFAILGTVAPDKAIEQASRLFATPPRHPHTSREVRLLETGARFTVIAGANRIAAWRFGNPRSPAVVASHGWGGRGAQFRAFVEPLVDAGFQVVLHDHIAHGHSEGEASTLVHFIEGLDAVVLHLEREGVRIAGLLGHSLGAAAAGAWLNRTRRPLPVVLIAPPTSVERYSALFARQVGLKEDLRRAMQERFERLLGRKWREFELPGAVADVTARALVIHDADDREVAPASGLALARAWPGAAYVGTRGLGHRQVLRDDGVVRDAVDFLADRVVFARPPAPGARAYEAPAPIL